MVLETLSSVSISQVFFTSVMIGTVSLPLKDKFIPPMPDTDQVPGLIAS
jgi:hypothetical protein